MSARVWMVSAQSDHTASVEAFAGLPAGSLRMAGPMRADLGTVTAETKGAAIVAAHAMWPRIPVAELDVVEVSGTDTRPVRCLTLAAHP